MTASLISTLIVILLGLFLGEIAAKFLVGNDVPPDQAEDDE